VKTPAAENPPAPAAAALPDAPAVEAFLRANPGFLAARPHLLRLLDPPRRVHGEALADHMAAMLGAERRHARGLEAALLDAAAAGRAGQGLSLRVRLAVLALMRTTDVPETVSQELPALLGIECGALLAEAPDRAGVLKLPPGAAARLLPPGRDALVRAQPSDLPLLHAEAAPLIRRDALVRVPARGAWLLALGARDPQALPARQSAATLGFLGRAVAAALAR